MCFFPAFVPSAQYVRFIYVKRQSASDAYSNGIALTSKNAASVDDPGSTLTRNKYPFLISFSKAGSTSFPDTNSLRVPNKHLESVTNPLFMVVDDETRQARVSTGVDWLEAVIIGLSKFFGGLTLCECEHRLRSSQIRIYEVYSAIRS